MLSKRNSKKSFIIIGTLLIILSTLLGGCMKKKPTVIEDKQKIEYGDDLTDQTFTINHEDEETEGNFTDLDPEVDTLELGETEHKVELDGKQFLVTVVVEDTEMPVFSGVEDVVDGELEVIFEINEAESEHTYDVEAKSTDKNDNETVETFEVVVEIEEIKEVTEKEEIPFETTNKDDASLNTGTTKVSAEGENGTKEITYEVTYINGEEKSREKVKEKNINKPKDKIVLNGTKPEANSGAQSKQNTGSKSNSNTSNNSSSNNTQEKPKEESKPKPESKPSIKGPSGSTLIETIDAGYLFTYNDSSLPGGGKIIEIGYITKSNEVAFSGVDKSGNMFTYDHANNRFITFTGEPNLSNDAIAKMQSIGNKFQKTFK